VTAHLPYWLLKVSVAALLGVAVVASVARADDLPMADRLRAADQAFAQAPPPWTVITSTEVRYFSWKSNRGTPTSIAPGDGGGSGSELYVPFAAKLVGKPLNDLKAEFLVRGGWVWARQNTGGLTGEVATSTDTVANATFTYLGVPGFQPFVAVSFNFPTGRSALFGADANARMDGDLVDVASFGEGFNVGPTLGVSLPITSTLVITMSGGYTARGSYWRENSLNATNPNVQTLTSVDPGDVQTVTASIANKWGPWSGSITGTFSWEGVTFENGIPLYKPGNRYLATGTLSYTWANGSLTTLNGSFAHSNRNEVLFANTPYLLKEIMNTNSDMTRVGIQHLIPIDRLTIGPTGSFVYRNHNGYDSTTLQFVPEKERWTAGFIARYGVTDKVILNARLDHVWTHEDDHPSIGDQMYSVLAGGFVLGSAIPIVSSTGWQAAIGATISY
jgi:hypothetical protein